MYNSLFDAFDAMDAMFSDSEKYAVPQFPPSEVLKHKDGTIEISIAVAGYKKEDISISTEENKLVVSTISDYKAPKLPDEISVISSNRIKRSAFKNSFIVPETKFDFNSITAKFEDGLLTITIPPKEKKEYKQITIA
jgi:HSP20 family molecular chaperone IbpA